MPKKLFLIANEESGSFISSIDRLENLLQKNGVEYRLHRVKKLAEAAKVAEKASNKAYSAVAVFGGDGTVVAVAKVLVKRSTLPLLVLPGGTANGIANELGPSASIAYLIKKYAANEYVIRHSQLADCNGNMMTLDAHFGLFADALESTPRQLKSAIGIWAYYLSTARKIVNAQPSRYRLIIDGQRIDTEGYVCFIVNHGNPKIFGRSLLPRYRDGMVRLALIRSVSFFGLIRWYFVKTFFGRNRSSIIISRRAETITIEKATEPLLVDDQIVEPTYPLTFSVSSQTLRVIVPTTSRLSFRNMLRVVQTTYYRGTDHARRYVSGTPSLRYSRISTHLYLGGQYGTKAIPLFEQWGVSGIISMREFVPKKIENITILHLPTVDMTPPTLADLDKGVRFITKRIDKGESVYVHCKLGEGRGPSMAAAYLISTGMRPQDAIYHLQRTRPFVRPNQKQVAQLMKFAEKYIPQD